MKCCECVEWIELAQNRVRWVHRNKCTYSATVGYVCVCGGEGGIWMFLCLYK